MDIAAIKQAKDEELQALGLKSRGDILSLRAFAEKGSDTSRTEKKRSLLQALKEKFSGERLSKKKRSESTLTEKKHDSTKQVAFRKIYAGWQHYDKKQKRYVAVRLVKGGGTRDIDAPVNASKEELISQMKSVFFPDETSAFGKTDELHFGLGNFKCEEINDDDFTLSQYITRHRLSKCRLYILTKRYDDIVWGDDEEDNQSTTSVTEDTPSNETEPTNYQIDPFFEHRN